MIMIKLRQLDKFYNRNKQNEIHVLNNISLDLPTAGLVVLLGPSGSGKTTLLNVLGGLDKVQSGSIAYGDNEMNRYNWKVWDNIRNKEVGYIFQNYNLLTHLTVYENISLTLNMIGIYDKEEIDRRIDYILNHMGMINYRKRRASQLSGGQQQRVAIARALAKNPQVIIADEPTGNLDSKNTQDIMNIIKAISRNKLVVLVTHEEDLANYYADRIIRLQDGKIVSDETNLSNGSLDFRHETDIYLNDMHEILKSDQLNIFSDEPLSEDFKVRLIVKNKTMYVDIDSKQYKKRQLIEKDSEIQIHEGSYKATQRDEFQVDEFNLDDIIVTEQTDHTKHSVISVKDSLRIAWSRMKSSNLLGKVFYIAFALIAGLVAVSVGMGNSYVTIDPEDYLQDSKQLVVVDKGLFDYEDFLDLEDQSSIAYVRLYERLSMQMQLPTVFQSYSNTNNLNATGEDIELLEESDIIAGRNAASRTEFVVDKVIADRMISDSTNRYLGISTYEDLFEIGYSINVNGLSEDYTIELTLVGIVDSETPLMYLNQDILYMMLFDVGVYEYFADDITLVEGALPTDQWDLLVADHDFLLDPISNNQAMFYNQVFPASGSFTLDEETTPAYLVRREDIKEAYFEYQYSSPTSSINLIATDPEEAVDYLTANQFTAEWYFVSERASFQQERIAQGVGTITFIFVVLAASAISYFFVIRSSLLARIYEVSVYRALGVNRLDIHKMFAVETILVTTLTSVFGYAAATVLLWRLQLLIEDFATVIKVTPLSIAAGLLIVYLVNLLSGIIPVANLLRKTPAEILSKYDF